MLDQLKLGDMELFFIIRKFKTDSFVENEKVMEKWCSVEMAFTVY